MLTTDPGGYLAETSCLCVRVGTQVQLAVQLQLIRTRRTRDLWTVAQAATSSGPSPSPSAHFSELFSDTAKLPTPPRSPESVADLSAPVSPSTYFVRARIHVIGGLHLSGAGSEGTLASEL